MSLAYEGTRSGLKGYIVLGTNYNYGEDITSRGRVSSTSSRENLQFNFVLIILLLISLNFQILIFDIIEVVPEPGQPLTKNRFKQIYAKEQKGPITAITQVSGFLVSAVGQKVLSSNSLEWISEMYRRFHNCIDCLIVKFNYIVYISCQNFLKRC